MKKLILLCSTAIVLPTAAFAQSTGTQEFENEAIIVTGTRTQEVGGVQVPDTGKPKAVLTQEYIGRQNPGQTILDTINAVPGVSFQNNDAYGSSGGTLNIRGFAGDRISLTFDGVPLNDSGNYAIYSNQQIDPELIDQVNVNLGTTDVDSPTAAAVGGTVNYRTRNPATKFGGRVVGSLGQFDFRRIFALIDTGEIGPWGTRAYFAVSNAKNDNPFNNYGKVDKQQYNAKIYQPIGNNGDFVAVSGHYNQNRNNFFGSVPLRNDLAVPNGFPQSRDDREYDIDYPCTMTPGVFEAGPVTPDPDAPNNCGSEFDRRYNPSNTGNIRINSRFSLTDKLTLTVDPSYQYVKANGGGTSTAREYGFDINPNPGGNRANCSTAAPSPNVVCIPGYYGGSPYFGGVDLNGDGDILDTVRVLTPSQTRTYRFGVIAGLRYDINDDHIVRLSYTFDHANHRQTGEVGLLRNNGEPFDVFPVNDPLSIAFGGMTNSIQKRDRQSYAILHQVSGEYIGSFMDDRLTVNIGARLPFFKRDLENNCFTSSSNGFVECSGENDALDDVIGDNNPSWSPPQTRVLKYNKLLPNLSATFDITRNISAFGSYAKGLSVPGTDALYESFFWPTTDPRSEPEAETTDTFDAGLRYRSSKIQAQVTGWHTRFENRLSSSFDPIQNQTVFRNLGTVNKWGIDGSIAYAPIKQLSLYAFGSWKKSKIKDNLQLENVDGVSVDCDTVDQNSFLGLRNCAFTAGKQEAGSPKYMYGLAALGTLGNFELGFTAKRTGPRYVYDDNRAVFDGDLTPTPPNPVNIIEVYPNKVPAYWLVNLDARFNLTMLKGLEKSYFAVNVYNLFDELYAGGFGGFSNQPVASSGFFNEGGTFGIPFVQIGAPRTISGTLSIQW